MRAEVAIKEGDKLYLVTRSDLSAGYQAVQSCHALRQFVHEHPERDKEWFENSNYLAFLSVENEQDLSKLLNRARDRGLCVSEFREPDIDDALTAIAIEPHPITTSLCKNISLALKI